jgi:hypothetical protein
VGFSELAMVIAYLVCQFFHITSILDRSVSWRVIIKYEEAVVNNFQMLAFRR